jgi:hypothetical protein
MVEMVAVAEPKPVEVAPPSSQQPLVKQPAPKERLDMERAEIRTRVATFKANQQRFQREREEYYATTMAKARATQWTPPKRDHVRSRQILRLRGMCRLWMMVVKKYR